MSPVISQSPVEFRLMTYRRFAAPLSACAAALLSLLSVHAPARADMPVPEKVEFNRDVRLILSDKCFACHGFDKAARKADLRLDMKEGLFGKLEEGGVPVVPGKPDQSEVYKRITAADPDDVMPPKKFHKKLEKREIEIIKRWIEQGAVWQGHWAYVKPVKAPAPAVEEPKFVRNAVDKFVLAKLKEQNLKPSGEADRVTLIRRLSFDLTGLPPAKADVDAFVNDKSPDAYEKLVEKLLASPHFGERMAMYWLDLVRYADSIGYHSDNPQNVSPYREYVIRSFNENKPFDKFTVEQIAGDLIPNATATQKIASTYNRLLQTTEEGGAQAKEYLAKYSADRVRNVSSVWLGQTMGCAECHDHKFDPILTKDFYTMAAFFADIQEPAVGGRGPGTPVPTPEHEAQLKSIDEQVAALKKQIDTPTPQLAAAQAEWEKQFAQASEWRVLEPETIAAAAGTTLAEEAGGVVKAGGALPAKETYTVTAKTDLKGVTGIRLEALNDGAFPAGGPGASPNGNFVLTEFKVSAAVGGKPAANVELHKPSADFEQNGFPVAGAIDGKNETGWAVMPNFGVPHTAVFEVKQPIGADGNPELDGPTTLTIVLDHQSPYGQHQIGKFRLSVTTSPNPAGIKSIPGNVQAALAVAAEQRTEAQKNEIAAYYRTIAPLTQPQRDQVAQLEKQKADMTANMPTALITIAGPPREIRILPRGNWLDETGPVVQPAVPAVLPQITPKPGQQRLTRLELAEWLVSRDNPLPSRVFTNRLWKLFFSQGISKSLEDLGSQGEWPTHPELLDYLAVEFHDSKWDVKHMVRLLVNSGTYRQTSRPTPDLRERDPFNRLYARQSPYRLDAEVVRDNALAVSGLLVHKLGGKSVFPYQPAGYWAALNFPAREWQNGTGEDLYRRGLYTHWQRSFLHPSLLAFDAPSREEGVCERPRSNIPQQALVLLNDPTYVEASRVFAQRMIKEGGATPEARIKWAFGTALSREPVADEVRVLSELQAKHLADYKQDPESAKKVLTVGAAPADAAIDPVELASWTSVARTIMNLHETITRR